MLNFTERTGCGAVMLVWSFPIQVHFKSLLQCCITNRIANELQKTHSGNSSTTIPSNKNKYQYSASAWNVLNYCICLHHISHNDLTDDFSHVFTHSATISSSTISSKVGKCCATILEYEHRHRHRHRPVQIYSQSITLYGIKCGLAIQCWH